MLQDSFLKIWFFKNFYIPLSQKTLAMAKTLDTLKHNDAVWLVGFFHYCQEIRITLYFKNDIPQIDEHHSFIACKYNHLLGIPIDETIGKTVIRKGEIFVGCNLEVVLKYILKYSKSTSFPNHNNYKDNLSNYSLSVFVCDSERAKLFSKFPKHLMAKFIKIQCEEQWLKLATKIKC